MDQSRTRVAFLDDSATVRMVLTSLCEEAGYEPLSCSSWEELNTVVRDRLPHLVLLDVQMPRVSGPPIAVVLKRLYPELKVVLLSDYAEEKLRSLAKQSGADGFIRKTTDGVKLLQAISAHLPAATQPGAS